MELKRAALLLPSNEMQHFAPWAAVGLDRTTEQRLRLPFSLVRDLLPDTAESCIIGAEEEQQKIQPYVSHRELSSDKPMMLFAFREDDLPLALLLVAETPYLELDAAPAMLGVIVSAISEPATQLLSEHRSRQLNAVRHRATFTAGEVADTPQEILSEQKQPLTAMKIDGGALIRTLSEHFTEADRFRVKQDLIRIVSAVVAEIGVVVDLSRDTLLVFLANSPHLDSAVLAYHISAAVRHIFVDVPEEWELPIETRLQGDESVDEFARVFL